MRCMAKHRPAEMSARGPARSPRAPHTARGASCPAGEIPLPTHLVHADHADRRASACDDEIPDAPLADEPIIAAPPRQLDVLGDQLPPRSRALIALRVSSRLDCSCSWCDGVLAAFDCGLTLREIACVAAQGTDFTGREATTLHAVDELLRDERLSDWTLRALDDAPVATAITIATNAFQRRVRRVARLGNGQAIGRIAQLASPLRARVTYAALIHADAASTPGDRRERRPPSASPMR